MATRRQPVDRIARAATLVVTRVDSSHFRIEGGESAHVVTVLEDGLFECDCDDYRFRQAVCAHIIAAQRALERDDHVVGALFRPEGGQPGLQENVPLPDDLESDHEPHRNGGPPAAAVAEERCDDLGNARRLVRQHGEDLRHVRSQRRWYAWDGRRWREDVTGEAERRAKAVVNGLFDQAAGAVDEQRKKALAQHAVKSAVALRVRSMLELASTEPELVVRVEQFDAGPWILNVQNGSLDLRTGKLREHQRADYFTKLAPVRWDPDAKAPRWERFLSEITAADKELASFLQRAIGYSLTGDTREQCLFFCHGQGANGKSVFLETIQAMLGPEYAQTTPFSSFLTKSSDGPRNDLARLRAVRLVAASEAPGGQPMDEALLKQLVGGDTIAARFLHQEYFEFRPAFKLWLRANHRPPVREQTVAFWRRMRLVPFNVTIPAERRDRKLAEALRDELPGILAWAVRGCSAWQQGGLGEPAIVTQATAAYRNENDTLGEFLEARGTMDPHAWTSTADLYKAFVTWWEETHGKDRPLTRNWFGRSLGERSDVVASEKGHNKARGWAGVRLTGVLPGPAVGEGEARDELPF